MKELNVSEIIKQYDLKIIHIFDFYHNFGGATVVYRKCENYKNSRMVEVAVAYCSPHDTYNKKIGIALAVEKYCNGETIVVPARTRNSDDTIVDNLRAMFALPL